MHSKPYDFDGFVGDFKDLLVQFVQMKQSLGFSYVVEADQLKCFSRFTLNFTIENHALTRDLADAWTAKRPDERDHTRSNRINYLRQFALFLSELGYDAYIPVCKAKFDLTYIPYIFTSDQIQQIFAECDRIKPVPLSNRHLTLPAVYRLLYGCGLRISEALSLKRKDVDLNQGIVTIRGSKFDKDRLIPMAPSLIRYLEVYSSKIHTYSTSEDDFFSKKYGGKITVHDRSAVYKNFRKILWKIGISHGGKGKGPRLHDVRHTFSVHALNQMVRQGMDLYCALPILSTYLGHASITATERYVRLTEEAYPGIMDAVSRTCAYVFPEVKIW